MTNPPSGAGGAPRLNPFAFPSNTDFRFMLLVVAVVGASLFMFNGLYNRFDGTRSVFAQFECAKAVGPASADSVTFMAQSAALSTCMAPLEQLKAKFVLAGMLLLLAVAGAIYLVFPTWKIARNRLVPLTSDDAPQIVPYLADLCQTAGLARPPAFVWNPFDRNTTGGSAFGRLGHYRVALSGGLVTQFATDRTAFRAVMLHELAHLRNADVDKTYLSLAIWWAFVATALVPYGIALASRPTVEDLALYLNLGWRSLALTALVWLTLCAILRSRELYADLRASDIDRSPGVREALRRTVAARPPLTGWRAWRLPRLLRRLAESVPLLRGWAVWDPLQVHPDPDERCRTLDDPGRLFRPMFWDTFAAGAAAMVAFDSTERLLHSLTYFLRVDGVTPSLLGLSSTHQPSMGASLIFAAPAAGVVGVTAWRATFAWLLGTQAPLQTWRLGLSLAAGVLVGFLLSFDLGMVTRFPHMNTSAFAVPISNNIVWGVPLLGGLILATQWMATCARAWLPVVMRWPSPRPVLLVGLGLAGGLLAIWVGAIFSIRPFVAAGADSPSLLLAAAAAGAAVSFWLLFGSPITLLALASLWAFPLMASIWPGQRQGVARCSWAFLEPLGGGEDLPRERTQEEVWHGHMHLRLAAVSGMVVGLAFCVTVLLLRLRWQLDMPADIRATPEAMVAFDSAQVARGILLQVSVAAFVAGRVRQLSGLYGLFAAFLTGSIMAAGLLGLNRLFGGGLDLPFAWLVFSQVVTPGALLALPVAFGLPVLIGWVTRRGTTVRREGVLAPRRQLMTPPDTGSRGGPTVRTALRAGALFSTVCFVAWVAWTLTAPPAAQRATDSAAELYAPWRWQLQLAVLLQLGVAMRVASRRTHRAWLHGLAAAVLAGCVMAAGVLASPFALQQTAQITPVLATVSLVIFPGVLLSVPAAIGASIAARWLRWTRRSPHIIGNAPPLDEQVVL